MRLLTLFKPNSRLWRIARATLLGLLAAWIVGWLAFKTAVTFWPGNDCARIIQPATRILDCNREPLAAYASREGQWHFPLAWGDISPHLRHAIVAVEDQHFYEHDGMDWNAVIAAAWQNLTRLHVVRGGSTLTMQLQRIYEPHPRTFCSKIADAIRACQMERRDSKESILTQYLNHAPFGGNIVGAGAASWRYFNKPCRDLSLGQAALLAGLPQSPNRLRPDRHPGAARLRRAHVLERMLACRMISAAQRDAANAEPVDAHWQPLPQSVDSANGAAAMLVIFKRTHADGDTQLSLDSRIQQQTFALSKEHLSALRLSGVNAAAVVVLDTASGHCLASVSLSHEARDIDLTRSTRSTGSVLKPFIYAAAFESGICTPDTIIDDSPSAWPGYVPQNFDREYKGKITAARALAESRNIPALQILSRIGPVRMSGILESFGMRHLGRTPERYGLSMAIGGAEASPCEIAEGYATLARAGIHRRPSLTCHNDATENQQVMNTSACLQALGALNEFERTARISRDAARLATAWKTGTSSGHRDAWCAAVTPRRTVVVWLGNPDGEGTKSLTGVEVAAPLALRVLAACDPGGETWPAVQPQSPQKIQSVATTPPPAPLTIISPCRGQQFYVSPDLPAENQKIHLKFSGHVRKYWWFIDSEPVTPLNNGNDVWWAMTKGTHEARVVDDEGHSATVRFSCL